MNKEQLLQFITEEEARLWKEYTELRDAYGYDHKATRYASAKWNAILTLLDEVKWKH